MDGDTYTAVDTYLEGLFGGEDAALAHALERAEAAGLPPIQVSPAHGRLLHVLALASGARRILEIGTLAGYSAIWLARALPTDGTLTTIELDPRHAEVARRNLDEAGVADRVDLRVGNAVEVLAQLQHEQGAPFDLVFIDADKPPYAEYLDASISLSRPGALIVADNVIREGAVARGASDDQAVAGIQRFNAALAADPRITAAVLQLVGVKGHDGMAFAVVGPAR
jgi:caffeoyl-CoA O-methyltransferase